MRADPMHQFQVERVLTLPKVAGMDLSITNTTLAMFAAAGLVCAFFAVAFNRAAVVPGRMQTLGEMMFGLIDDLSESIIGHAARPFFPFVFSMFTFVMMMNLLGMTIIVPTATSQLIVTATLAVLTILIVIAVGFARNGLGFFKLFVPTGVPWWLFPLIVPIEVLSFLIRPLTLALRLFGNMLGGHVVLNIFGYFVVSLAILALGGGVASLAWLVSALSLTSVVALIALEFVVAFLQAFVFAVLTCVYLNDVVNLHDH